MAVISLKKGEVGWLASPGTSFETAKSWESLAYGSANISVALPWDEQQMELGQAYVLAKLVAGTAYHWSSSGMDDSIIIYDYARNKVAESQMDEETWSGQILNYTPSATGLFYFRFSAYGWGETTISLTGTVAPAINDAAPKSYQTEMGLDGFGKATRENQLADANVCAQKIPENGLILYHPMTGELSKFGNECIATYEFGGYPEWTTLNGMPICDMRPQGYMKIQMYNGHLPSQNDDRTYAFWASTGSWGDELQRFIEFGSPSVRLTVAQGGGKFNLNVTDDTQGTINPVQGTVYHIAITCNNCTWKVYINGVLDIDHYKKMEISTDRMWKNINIGVLRSGVLGPVRIYNRALSSSEIWRLAHEYTP